MFRVASLRLLHRPRQDPNLLRLDVALGERKYPGVSCSEESRLGTKFEE